MVDLCSGRRKTMKIGDLVVFKGWSSNTKLRHEAWGVILALTNQQAEVSFVRLRSPCPVEAGPYLNRIAQDMAAIRVPVPLGELRSKGLVPLVSMDGMAEVFIWEGAPVTFEMVQSNRLEWVEALESGNYRQASNCLRVRTRRFQGYSAMGVACDVLAKKYGVIWAEKDDGISILGEQTIFPSQFQQLLDMSSKQCNVVERMNDSGYTFQKIAVGLRLKFGLMKRKAA
jgi:hypothetical protein